jgi:hypothetical protein
VEDWPDNEGESLCSGLVNLASEVRALFVVNALDAVNKQVDTSYAGRV